MSIVGIIIAIIIIGALYWCVRALIGAFSIQDPIATIIYVVLVLLVLVWLLGQLGYGPGVNLRL